MSFEQDAIIVLKIKILVIKKERIFRSISTFLASLINSMNQQNRHNKVVCQIRSSKKHTTSSIVFVITLLYTYVSKNNHSILSFILLASILFQHIAQDNVAIKSTRHFDWSSQKSHAKLKTKSWRTFANLDGIVQRVKIFEELNSEQFLAPRFPSLFSSLAVYTKLCRKSIFAMNTGSATRKISLSWFGTNAYNPLKFGWYLIAYNNVCYLTFTF